MMFRFWISADYIKVHFFNHTCHLTAPFQSLMLRRHFSFVQHIPSGLLNKSTQYQRQLLASVQKLRNDTVASHNFQDTISTTRRTTMYGYSYFNLANGDRTFTPIPSLLRNLCGDCIEALESNGVCDLGIADDYTNVI